LKKIFKKNQIIITALALMIAIAGYLQYSGTGIEDMAATKQASSDVGELSEESYEISDEDVYRSEEIFTDTEDNGAKATAAESDQEKKQEDSEGIHNPGEAVLTSTAVDNLNFAAEVKLNREQIRSKNKETLMDVINNAAISENQKQDAVNSMIQLTDIAERESAAEMLLEAKGFHNAVVSITEDSVDVVLDMGEVTEAKRAQVEDIVKRKTNISAENIVLTPIQTSKK
jgi:stage III sporulation protein AH